MQDDVFRRWFCDLEGQLEDETLKLALDNDRYIEPNLWLGWSISCKELLKLAYGEQSAYYCRFVDTLELCDTSEYNARWVAVLHAVFQSSKNDYLNGYVFDIDLRISGEVFGDFIALASAALKQGRKEVASVLAAASLEDVLKRYAIANGIETDDRNMTTIIDALKAKSLIQRGTSKALQPLPKIRDFALHAERGKLSEPEIGGMIGFIQQFLVKNFSAEIN